MSYRGSSHVTRDTDTTFKVKRSKVNLQGGRGILWRPPAQLVYFFLFNKGHCYIITVFCLLRFSHAFQFWHGSERRTIDTSIDQWRAPLKVCIRNYVPNVDISKTCCKLIWQTSKELASLIDIQCNKTSLHHFDLTCCKSTVEHFLLCGNKFEGGVSFNYSLFCSSFLKSAAKNMKKMVHIFLPKLS